MYESYGSRADFYWVYVREAHPAGSARPARHVEIEQPRGFEERREVAATCKGDLELSIPVLVDDMKDTLANAYNAMPDRLFILGGDGKVAYRGDRGPRGFDPDGLERALEKLLSASR